MTTFDESARITQAGYPDIKEQNMMADVQRLVSTACRTHSHNDCVYRTACPCLCHRGGLPPEPRRKA